MTSRESMSEDRDCGMDAAAYVLGALEGDELEAFRRHLSTCVVCRDEVSAFQQVADTLPLLAPSQPVPRSLKRRVMTQVGAEPQAEHGSRRRRLRPPSLFTALSAPALAASAVVLAVVVLIGAIAIGSGGGTTHVYSASVTGPGSAQLRVTNGRGELVVQDMPAPPGNDIYQVWLKRGSQAPSPTTALFSVTSAGSGAVDVPGDLHGVDAVLVTPEPPGGSPAPTHSPVIIARLT